MYRKLAYKIKFFITCILFLGMIVTVSIGIVFINMNQVPLGFFILFGGPLLSFLLFSLLYNLCDIIDNLYYIVRYAHIKNSVKKSYKENFCPQCGKKLYSDECQEPSE